MLQRGTQLGPYEILAPIGAGGMGEVYRARDSRLDRDVAVKIVPEHLSSETERLARFEREARAVAALSHPNILILHDIGAEQGISFVVTELLEGETLREHLARGPLACRRALEISAALADGLAAAHAKGIVHRDVKPENIFLTREGRVKILDFGLAHTDPVSAVEVDGEKTRAYGIGRTEPGAVLGTVGYMSPEQVRGEPVDGRSDIFSLGCVLQEMVTGKAPFNCGNRAESLAAILHEDPPEVPATAVTDFPESTAVLERCLRKKPEQRFESADALLAALRAALRGSSETGSPIVASSGRSRRAVLVSALVIVILVAGLIVYFASPEPAATRIDSLAVLPLVNVSGDPEEEFFADGMTDGLILDLSKIGSLKKVISYRSAMVYKGDRKPLPEVARELGVNGIVEGTVLRVGGRVRITAKLFHAPTETPLWADKYERELGDALALQSEVARAVAQAIRIRLTPEEEERLPMHRPVNPRAFELTLKGRAHFNRYNLEGFRKARQYFELALQEDPDFALAHAWMVPAYGGPAFWGYAPPETVAPAKEHALLAVENDETLADAHSMLASHYFFNEFDWPKAGASFRRALGLNPGRPDSYFNYACYLLAMGRREDALEQVRRGEELDPLSPVCNTIVGLGLLTNGEIDEAIALLEAFLQANPGFIPGEQLLWRAYVYKGLDERAYVKARDVYGLFKPPKADGARVRQAMERGWAEGGYRRAMLRGAETLVAEAREKYVQPTLIATLYLDAGEPELALDWLEKAYEIRDPQLVFLFSRDWMSLRLHPRFQAILRRMKLPMYPPE